MVQKILMWLLFLPALVWAHGPDLPRGVKSCLARLSSSSGAKILDNFDHALLIRGLKENEKAKLLLLESLLKNPGFHSAIADPRSPAATKFRSFITLGASQDFYKKVIDLLEEYSPPHAFSYILAVKQNLLPTYMPSPNHMPRAALQENPKRTRLLIAALELIFERNLYLKPVHFSRRIFAYMSRFPDLTQSEKYNLTANLILEFRHQVATHNELLAKGHGGEKNMTPISLYSFHLSPEVAEDGTRFICGTSHCAYYFAITLEGGFFIVHRDYTSLKFDPNKWNQHVRVREAVEP